MIEFPVTSGWGAQVRHDKTPVKGSGWSSACWAEPPPAGMGHVPGLSAGWQVSCNYHQDHLAG